MHSVEFRRLFDEENAARVRFELDRNRVVQFVVQLECLLGDEWIPVVRYDTAHGFAHRDLLYPLQPPEKKEMLVKDLNKGLNYALQDLAANWEKYRKRYEQWLED